MIAAREALSEGKAHPAAISRSDMKKTAFVIAQAYLYKYFVDPNGFIDRAGTKYVAPQFSGTVANPEITAAVGILLEAVYDSLLDTPVWVDDKGNAVTKTESTPAAWQGKPCF